MGELSRIGNVDRFTKHINENELENKIRFEEKTSNPKLEFLHVKVCLKDGYLMPGFMQSQLMRIGISTQALVIRRK